MTETLFILQSYRAKPHRLVAMPAQLFAEEEEARRAAGRLARFRAGIVVASQTVDPLTARRSRPDPLVIYGRVPDEWLMAKAA